MGQNIKPTNHNEPTNNIEPGYKEPIGERYRLIQVEYDKMTHSIMEVQDYLKNQIIDPWLSLVGFVT